MTAATDAVVAIHRLQSAYADTINRRDWADLVPLFAPDAVVTIDTPSPGRSSAWSAPSGSGSSSPGPSSASPSSSSFG